MTPSSPSRDVIIPVRLPPLISLVGAAQVDGFWSETQAQPARWRAGRKQPAEWKPAGRPDGVVWEKREIKK